MCFQQEQSSLTQPPPPIPSCRPRHGEDAQASQVAEIAIWSQPASPVPAAIVPPV
jgi:hypothetical protein